MTHVSSPVPQGIGGFHHLSRLSPTTEDSQPSRLRSISDVHRPDRAPVDEVRISDRARIHLSARPIDLPPPGDAPDDSSLLGAARDALQFLNDHPRMARTPFGKAIGLLVRAAAHLSNGEGLDDLPDASKARLMRAIETLEGFLEKHPRAADAPIGEASGTLARGIAEAIAATDDGSGTGAVDRLTEAARKADRYLDDNPKLADMPLGQVVRKLVDRVKTLAEGNPLDADLQSLAKRVRHFVQTHPRLAESEFGQIVSHLVRGIIAFDASPPPDGETPVAGDVAAETEAAAAVTDEAEAVDPEDVPVAA